MTLPQKARYPVAIKINSIKKITMSRKFFSDFLPIFRHYGLIKKINFANTLKWNVKGEFRSSSTSLHVETNIGLSVDEELQEIFKLKNIKISNWIIEVSIFLTSNKTLFLLKVFTLKNICRTKYVHYVSDILKATERLVSRFYAHWLYNMLCNIMIYAK